MRSSPRRPLFAGILLSALGWWLVSPGNQRVKEPDAAPAVPTAAEAARLAGGIPAPDPATAFDAWLQMTHRDPAEGERLARARRPVFQRLIASDPQAALARAIAPDVRAGLPPEIAAHIEAPLSGIGRLSVIATCAFPGPAGHHHAIHRSLHLEGRRYTLHAQGRALAFPSQEAFAANGIALGDDFALADPASDVRPAVASAWTLGEKRVLWIRVAFADSADAPASPTEIQQSMAEVDAYYRDASRRQTSFTTTILPGVLRVSRTRTSIQVAADAASIEAEALALAAAYAAAQPNPAEYDPARFDRVIVLAPAVPSIPFGGSATVGARGLYLNGIFAASTVAHELGHNHGLQHAHAWRPSGSSAIGAGTHLEYGDAFDVMGFLTPAPLAHFNTKSKVDLHFLEAAHTQTIETTGVYRLHRHDHAGASGLQALRIASGDHEYWIEHRRLQNSLWAQHASRFQNGVQLRWGSYAATQPGPGTYLLDATPRTPDSQTDAPLTQGETFTDLPQGISISPIRIGGSSPAEWIDVQVTYGALPGSGNRDPVVEVSFPSPTVPARTSLPFRAVVSDPDGDATTVRWDFADGTAAQFGADPTHRYDAGGTYRVSCIVTDGRGGRTARSVTLTVDDPLQSWTTLSSPHPDHSVLAHTGKELLSISGSVRASSDGATWMHRADLNNLLPLAVANSGTRYVAVGKWTPDVTRGIIYTSADGVAWQSANIPPPPALKSIAFGAGRFVAVGLGGAIMHSVDGVGWTYAPAATVYDLNSICFAADRFVAVGNSGVILTSRDGLTWQATTLGDTLHAVAYFRGRWHAAASNAVWRASADAQHWTVTATPTLLPSRGFDVIGDELLISRGDFDGIQYSVDGERWTTATFATPQRPLYVSGLAVADGAIYTAGSNGEIRRAWLRSPTTSPPQPELLPVSQVAPIGKDVYLTTGGTQPGVTYQWYKDGQPIAGAVGATLGFTPVQPSDGGRYHVTLSNSAGTTTTPPVTLSVDINTVRLVNLSVRTRLSSASEIFTLGFVVGPSRYSKASAAPKLLLARGAGPALAAAFGVADTLPDPRLHLFSGGTLLHSSDNWTSDLRSDFLAAGAFSFPDGSKDAALRASLELKPYTAQLASAPGGSGEVLVELYDLDSDVLAPQSHTADPPRLLNVSARGPVAAAAPLIGGFVLRGGGTRTLLIRAVGPALAGFGVADALAAPILTVLSGDRIQAANTAWPSAPDPAALRAAAASAGAFPLPEGSRDSALLIALPAGAYTAQASAPAGSVGIALLEVYEMP